MVRKVNWLIATAALLASPAIGAKEKFELSKIAELTGVPWGLTFVDQQTLIATTRDGKGNILNVDNGSTKALTGLPDVYARGQGGLMDVAVSPQNANTLYFTYSKNQSGGAATTLASATLNGTKLNNWTDLLITDSVTSTTRHFGSRIAFDNSGHLFFSVGDRGERPNGQDVTNHAATILRLKLDGSIPSDNPDISSNAKPEIWSYGHRNPQGLYFDSKTSALWSVEHGPRGGDEINLIQKGKNYGWPVTSHGKEYWGPISVGDAKEKEGIESPKKVYVPSIAPSSLVLYRGEHYPSLDGKILIGALKLTHINVVNPNGFSEVRLFEDLNERIRAIAISPSKHLYFSTDNGNIYRIEPSK
ncbi:dehydrogenase [Vibrio nigripulchritudo]|uniref:PQQ-dependent sugar dehydrogenase n=1 Tax=Vibrio nigripulchritudo TaxID=28173 RepID=UPI001909CD73|nr:PQQ-dependent sugar dehydrogenase [Vibrio nigripulchritudo]BCL70043.1 dehydrogenase [Vibrio nigripulchritudo]BDU31393.1 dehydrogenase [Vibrio nigripulchritudo]